jgi:hypothetical protein
MVAMRMGGAGKPCELLMCVLRCDEESTPQKEEFLEEETRNTLSLERSQLIQVTE